MNYPEAIDYLYHARPPFHIVGGAAYKPGLENTLALMAHLGHPHQRVRTIHVAGTNGKGSTSHLIAAVLQAAGMRVGLYTSPHLVDYRERIRINGEMIPEEEVAQWVTTHKPYLEELKPSFFETTFGLAMSWFEKQKVDVAVIETGLGGRLDATNVIIPLLSVITNIGMDHTEYLGNTLAKIAGEKAGIMKQGVPCVIGETHPQTMNVFLDRARACGILGDGLETTGCRIWFADQCRYLAHRREKEAPCCELKGTYQTQNIQTAYVALQVLKNYGGIGIPSSAIKKGFAEVCSLTGLRGRWETLDTTPLTICDTGHNSHGLRYVGQQLRELKAEKIWIVFGMVNDKDTEVVMRLMPSSPVSVYHYIFTTPATKRARTAEEMLALWKAVHGEETGGMAVAIDNPEDAIRYAQAHAGACDAIFIGGSNYLVGNAIQLYSHQV